MTNNTPSNDLSNDLPYVGLTPPDDERANYASVTVTPDLGEEHKFSLVLPISWHRLPSPPSQGKKHAINGLAVFSAHESGAPPILVSVAVFEPEQRATVAHHFERLAREQGIKLLLMQPQKYALGMVIEGIAVQRTEHGNFKSRLAMFEDGGKIYTLSAMAPEDAYAEHANTLGLALVTFELSNPRGTTTPLTPSP